MDEILQELSQLELGGLYERDFVALNARSDMELAGILAVADALRTLRERNYATRVFETGLAVYEDSASRMGWPAFAAGTAMLGLQAVAVPTLDELTLARCAPDVVAGGSDLPQRVGRLFGSVLDQRPLCIDPDSALPCVLEQLHAAGGVSALRGRRAPLPLGSDAAELWQRFGLIYDEDCPLVQDVQAEGLRAYVVAAMVLLGKCPDPVGMLKQFKAGAVARRSI